MKRVIYVSAPWCGPCGAFKPILKEVTTELGIPVEYVDVDTNPDIAEQYGIRAVPTTIFLNGDAILFKYSGAMSKSQLKSNLMG
jgi:thioredoxin 1